MKQINQWISFSTEESIHIAGILSAVFKPGDIVLMEGTLGSGKTFLVQHICQAWGIVDQVTSPTFTLIQQYQNNSIRVNHMDLYRIEETRELDQLGWEELVWQQAVSFIEWPQLIEQLLPEYYKISIGLEEEKRTIILFQKERNS